MLPPVSENGNERIMVLRLMQAQEVVGWEVLPAFDAPVDVRFLIVHLIVFESVEWKIWPMPRQRASHHFDWGSVAVLGVEMH
jgi:hypothetical protein